MKIYTKGGDQGLTSLLDGKRIPKYDDRIEAYGSIDELIAQVGLIRSSHPSIAIKERLLEIQDHLMICCAESACEENEECPSGIPKLKEEQIKQLEDDIDKMEQVLPQLTHFVLPGGNTLESFCHLARTVCRRAERQVLRLTSHSYVDPLVVKYLNRLSDYFFVLARKTLNDFEEDEIIWNTNTKY